MIVMARMQAYRFALVAAALAVALLLASCGGSSDGDDEPTPSGTISIEVWHSMPSLAQGVLQRMTDEFNASQSQYRVELIYQGGYTESLNKLISSIRSGNIPAVIQLSDVSTQIMIDSESITPVQEFIDAEGGDVSDFEPKAVQYYTVDDTLYAMPFNLAGPILYYDRGAFEDAGLNPDEPPQTLDEVRDYAEQLTVRDDSGNVVRQGISLQVSAWTFEEMLAKSGALYVDGENGREGRADEALFAGPEGVEIIEWWDGMIDDGLAYAAGDDVDAFLKVASGESAMVIASTAALRGAIAALTLAGRDPAQYDAAPMPGPEGDGGIALGGAAFWILSGRPSYEQQGAWEYLTFLSSPEQQAQWHADTGYFPSRVSANDLPAAVQAREEFPQFEVALQQLRDSPDTPATRGALLGPFNAVRDTVTRAFEEVLAGADPQQALQSAAEEANGIISDYNRTAP